MHRSLIINLWFQREAGVPKRVQKPPEYFLLALAFFPVRLSDSGTSVHL